MSRPAVHSWSGGSNNFDCISTSIVQSGLPFQVFPAGSTINGFTGAVIGATFGPAVIGEILCRTMAKNADLLSANIVDFNPDLTHIPIARIWWNCTDSGVGSINEAETYGWLLIIVALTSLLVILVSYSSVRPFAIFPKWSNVRRVIKHTLCVRIRILEIMR